jgi:hypothetical protein
MPKSKHRRKPGGKAVAHPGRDNPGRPINLSWLDELEEKTRTNGLPLFDWAEHASVSSGGGPSEEDDNERGTGG